MALGLCEKVSVGNTAAANARAREGGTQPGPGLLPSQEHKAELAKLAEQAARLAKADLVTEMVGEFPELQGIMGGYYARAEELPDAVADAKIGRAQSELQSLMRTSYAVFCLKKKKLNTKQTTIHKRNSIQPSAK